MFTEELLHALWHAAKHTLLLLPFLYLTYLAMEWLERRAGEKVEAAIAKAGRGGPLIGALLGLLPQCGFSAAGAGLYAGRVITAGTVLAIFWATSDEMLPLLLSSRTSPRIILTILACKAVVAALCGFAVDGIARLLARHKSSCDHGHDHDHDEHAIGALCREGHCHCEERALPIAALVHTASIALSVFLVSLALEIAFVFLGEDVLTSLLIGQPIVGCLLASLVGLIPNCASSVTITNLYAQGVLSAGAMLSGLLVGAGVGLLVLLRANRPVKDTIRLIAILFCVGAVVGMLFDLTGLGTLLGI